MAKKDSKTEQTPDKEPKPDVHSKDAGAKTVWSREACFKRYVEGRNITMIQLSKMSGRALGTIGRWAAQDNWKGARFYFQKKLDQDVKEKTLDKATEQLADSLSDISLANYKAHREMRDYVVSIIERKVKHLREIEYLDYLDWEREIKKHHSSIELNNLSMILARSTESISDAVGLPYHINVNAAYRKLEAEGYMVVDPNTAEDGERKRERIDPPSQITIDIDVPLMSTADDL